MKFKTSLSVNKVPELIRAFSTGTMFAHDNWWLPSGS